jgi:hypothetical protein
MPSRVVRQPNGKYAIFSTVVDSFTGANMTEEEVIARFVDRGNARADAERAVQRAKDEEGSEGQPNKELYRWNEALDTIRIVHGEKYLTSILKEVEDDPAHS